MPTTAQIQAFRQKAKAQGYSDAQIIAEIARKNQEEAKVVTNQSITQTQPKPAAVAPTTPIQPVTQGKSVGGLIKNAGQDVLDFTVNNVVNTGKAALGVGFEAVRAIDLKSKIKDSEAKTKQLRQISEKLKKEKDPAKKQALLEQSRALSGELDTASSKLRKPTETANPFMDVSTVPSMKQLGKGILKNVGSTFGVTKDESGNIVFDPQLLIDTAYEKPVSTALMAKDIAGGVKSLTKSGAKDTAVSTLAKESDLAKPGLIKKTGTGLRKDVLNPQVDASPFYADEVAALQKAQKEIGLEGSAQVQLEQLPAAFKKSQTEIRAKLTTAKPPQKNIVVTEFDKAVADSNYGLDDLQFSKAVEAETKIINSLKGKPALEYYKQLEKYRNLLKSTRKKIDNGTTLLPKEEARLAAFNALKATIDTVSPEVRALNTLQNQMYNISEGLVKSSQKSGAGIEILGNKLGVPNSFSQMIKDKSGRLLEGVSQIPDKVGSITGNLPNVPQGTGIGVGVTNALSLNPENFTGDPTNNTQNGNTSPEQNNQGGGNQNNNEQGLQQDNLQNNTDIISQGEPNPFAGLSKQKVLALAFQKGASKSDLEQISGLYDMFASQSEGVVSEDVQKAASSLRTEYIAQTKQNGFLDVVNAYRKVSSAPDTAAGDVSLIFAYMKMLDPGSTVREGEFATAENTAGIPDRIVTQYNKALKGRRIGAQQRTEFQGAAQTVYEQSAEQQKQIDDIYTELAGRYGVDPSLLSIGSLAIKER